MALTALGSMGNSKAPLLGGKFLRKSLIGSAVRTLSAGPLILPPLAPAHLSTCGRYVLFQPFRGTRRAKSACLPYRCRLQSGRLVATVLKSVHVSLMNMPLRRFASHSHPLLRRRQPGRVRMQREQSRRRGHIVRPSIGSLSSSPYRSPSQKKNKKHNMLQVGEMQQT